MMRNLFNSFNYSTAESKPSNQRGQGYTEYAIIISLVAIAIIAIISVMSPAISDTFKRLIDANAVAPPSIAGYTPPAPTSANPTDIPDTYQLIVNSVDDGIGSGSTSPAGESTQPSSQSVSIEATADSGSEFVGWEGDASGMVNPLSLMMNSDKVVSARFRVNCYNVQATAIGAGEILQSPDPNCPHNGGDYTEGTTVELRAIHDAGIPFFGWTGHVVSTDEIIEVVVDQDIQLEASFEVVCYTLNLNTPDGQGNVIIANPEPDCLGDTTRYPYGEEVSLSPQPAQGYAFERWANGDLDNTTNPGIIIMDGDKTVNAYYSERCLSLTTSVSGNGVINITNPSSPNCSDGVGYLLNTTLTLEAVPSGGEDFLFWSGHASGNNPIANVLVIDDTSVRANFGACYPLTLSTIGAGSIITNTAPNCIGGISSWYQRDTTVEIIAVPDQEYDFLNWSGDTSGNNQTLNLVMNAPKNAVANFEECYTLTATVNGNGAVAESGEHCSTNGDKYTPQTDVTLRANAIPGYQFDAWSVDLISTDNPVDITMGNDHSVTATFIPCDGPPSPWTNGDVGSVATAGGTCYDNGTFTVNGSGRDIWNRADEFQFARQPFSGDGYIIARIVSQQNTASWAIAGVMIRESLNANSRNVFTAITPSHGVRFQGRTATNGNSYTFDDEGGSAPIWVKLERQGDLFISSRSNDGSSWTEIGTSTVNMNADVYIGLAVSSYSDGILSEVIYDNVEIQKAQQVVIDFTGNGVGIVNLAPPNVDCTSRCVETYVNGTSVTLQATAESGSTFTGWSGDLSGSTNPDIFTVAGDMNITAEFSSNGQVLFVVGNPSSLNNADTAVVSRLQSLGYAVIIMDDGAVTSADADDKILVVVSSTSNGSAVGSKFLNVTTPVLTWERYIYDGDMLMATVAGADGGETQIKITYPTHPMAAGLGNSSSGLVDVFSPDDTAHYGVPPENAITIATIDNNPERAVIYGYDIGDLLSDGSTPAPARRVGFFMDDSGAANLTADGWTLFDAATDWAINGGGAPDSREQILMVSGRTTLSAADLLIFDRLQGMGYAVKIMDDNVATVANAIGKTLVVISSRSDPARIGTKFTNITTPILTWERHLYDELLMANATTSDSNETQLKILYSGHPMAVTPGNPDTGLVTVSESQNYHVARSPENAIVIASTDNTPADAAIFGYDIGDTLADGSTAAAGRRVGFFIDDDGASYLNSTGWDFFDAATDWAINGGGAPDSRPHIKLVANSIAINYEDMLIFNHLAYGTPSYRVTVLDDADANSFTLGNEDLIAVSVSVNAGTTGNAFRNTTVPVIVWEYGIFDDMKLAGGNNRDIGETQIDMVAANATHPLAAGKTGTLTITSDGRNFSYATGLGAGATDIATINGRSNRSVIFGYESGSAMDGMNAPARRVGFFIGNTNVVQVMSNDGWDLFDAAINWALGN